MPSLRRYGGWLCMAGLLLAAGLAVLLAEPPCVFRSAFGVLCPGCGLSRALRALMGLNLGSALAHNPNLLLLPILGLLLVADGVWPRASQVVRRCLIGLAGVFVLMNLVRPLLWRAGMLPWL